MVGGGLAIRKFRSMNSVSAGASVSAGFNATRRNGSTAFPDAYSSTCSIIDGTRLKVWCTSGKSSSTCTMP